MQCEKEGNADEQKTRSVPYPDLAPILVTLSQVI